MKANEIRQKFFDFFESKQHQIVASAPIVNKNDPTLMFTNAGMNQFKDFFLGNKIPTNRRIADTQKCLRVSGKHNDLEEVGIDSYHHTMFEMLGNWSFGDYFKKEAIDWAWELLTETYGLQKDRLYVSVFKGEESEGLEPDDEAAEFWSNYVSKDRILYFDKKDNFWEMGDVGPCGPCSEIHIDLRSDEDRAKVNGATLVNEDHPQVIEVWNLVFIQFNRKADGSLEELPEKHVDTGMGFERLCMALQAKHSNYDTDLFTPFISYLEKESGIKYTGSYDLSAKSDIAMRVVSDHLRAVSFTIADGELPSNTGAGYVIRRILRRAVRYYYSFLNVKEPLLHKLVDLLAEKFGDVFPELISQKDFVQKVILEEEKSFLNTLEDGLKRLDSIDTSTGEIDGKTAFQLYDTYGFPIDLTRLIASEQGLTLDEEGFAANLSAQRERGRADAKKVTGDWNIVDESNTVEFIGYDELSANDIKILKHRTVNIKEKDQYQIVLNKTPFYAEGGGQVGDTGLLWVGNEKVAVLDTRRENDLIIHIVKSLPSKMNVAVKAEVNVKRRSFIENNHSATHLLHAALRDVLGTHVQQRGSLVNDAYLRFDFSHFQKMTEEELAQVESIVNKRIRQNIKLKEDRSISIDQAKEAGAMMLFGEKYGDNVRMITFDPEFSIELCGGCHVNSTGHIGLLKIASESAVAAGVRRVEAVTADKAEAHINKELSELKSIRSTFKNPVNTLKNVESLHEENKSLRKKLELFQQQQASITQDHLMSHFVFEKGVNLLVQRLQIEDSKIVKTIGYNLEKAKGDALIVFGFESKGKPQLMVIVSESLIKDDYLHAGKIIKELAAEIKGGGGGQAFFASAGGSDASGLDKALSKVKSFI
jgi:alanyl-tRNA synthetase